MVDCIAPHEGVGYCKKHRRAYRKYGDPIETRVSSGRFKKGQGVKPKVNCTIDDCTRYARTKWYCQTHYMRWYHHGDPLYRPGRMRGTAKERLENMTDVAGSTGCIVWRGAVDKRGYGRIADDKGWYDMAHRLAYKLYVAKIPKGKVIHHKCFNTRCVNPEHLEPASHFENIITKGRSNAAYLNSIKTHCINGHELVEGSFYISKTRYNGSRVCKICHKARVQKYILKKEGAI